MLSWLESDDYRSCCFWYHTGFYICHCNAVDVILQLPLVEAADGQAAAPEFGFSSAPQAGAQQETALSWQAIRQVGAGFWLTDPQVIITCLRIGTSFVNMVHYVSKQVWHAAVAKQHLFGQHQCIGNWDHVSCCTYASTIAEIWLTALRYLTSWVLLQVVKGKAETLAKAQYARKKDAHDCALMYAALQKKQLLLVSHFTNRTCLITPCATGHAFIKFCKVLV